MGCATISILIWHAKCSIMYLYSNQASLSAAGSLTNVYANPVYYLVVEDDRLNVVMWLDHRAEGQAERINGTKHGVLRYTGGAVSPEMEMPKLLWLKEVRPAVRVLR